jgi:hypothetical protein
VFGRDLHFYLKDGENAFLENVVYYLPECKSSHFLLFYREDGGSMFL